MKYFDAFGEGGFHSAFMTTYAFGTLAFEDIPFPKLRGAGCRNIVVLADKAMVNQAFAEFGPPRFAGSSYHLVKAEAPGAFHPKISLLIGESKGRLMVGSANLTALGLGGNKEQVASITFTPEQPGHARLFARAVDYFRRYVPNNDPWFAVSLQRAMRSTPWLHSVDHGSGFESTGSEELNLLLDSPDISLLDQIAACVGGDVIERLIVVSPYWDTQLEGLARLRAALSNPPADILIENDANGFPSDRLARFPDVSVFDIGAGTKGRFVHAKLIVAHGRAFDHVISGSMNCTFPALLGPAVGGNAEAAIYKRVPRGSALAALELDNYQDAQLDDQQLEALSSAFLMKDSTDAPIDGGTLVLQSDRLVWTAPHKLRSEPASLSLFDRNGELVEEFDLAASTSGPWSLGHLQSRPKFGELHLADETKAAPIQIVDLDCLAVTTLPPQKGQKRQLIESLADALNEDLVLIETLSQLEALEDEEAANTAPALPKVVPGERTGEPQAFDVLPYDEFVRARTKANAKGAVFGTFLGSRQDRAANLISTCLNRMIGLVGIDLSEVEEKDLQAVSSIDFRTTEPQADEGGDISVKRPIRPETRRLAPSENRSSARKFQDAVSAFEQRCKVKQGKQITTSEMVRLRALLQIILSHAQPVSGTCSTAQILPVYTDAGYDWPRLIGRLLMQHFGATRALQYLTVEPDESEQQRVIEYLALASWAAKAAHSAVAATPRAKTLRKPIETLMVSLNAQAKTILGPLDNDRAYFSQIHDQLDQRFAERLRL